MATIPKSVETYASALASVRGAGVEELFGLAQHAREDLVGSDGVLESLSDSAYEAVKSTMTGVTIEREDALVVEPDPEFFLRLARARDDGPSIAFFEAYSAAIPGGVWPATIERQTDYSGCIKFGSLALVGGYRRWSEYAKKFPDHYSSSCGVFLGDIEDQLSAGTCACEGKESVLKELRAFVKEFPSASIANRVRQRIGDVERDEVGLRYRCISG